MTYSYASQDSFSSGMPSLQYTAPHCTTLQHTATQCQHLAPPPTNPPHTQLYTDTKSTHTHTHTMQDCTRQWHTYVSPPPLCCIHPHTQTTPTNTHTKCRTRRDHENALPVHRGGNCRRSWGGGGRQVIFFYHNISDISTCKWTVYLDFRNFTSCKYQTAGGFEGEGGVR